MVREKEMGYQELPQIVKDAAYPVVKGYRAPADSAVATRETNVDVPGLDALNKAIQDSGDFRNNAYILNDYRKSLFRQYHIGNEMVFKVEDDPPVGADGHGPHLEQLSRRALHHRVACVAAAPRSHGTVIGTLRNLEHTDQSAAVGAQFATVEAG